MLETDVVTRVEKGVLRWFDQLEKMNESRLTKQTYRGNACDAKAGHIGVLRGKRRNGRERQNQRRRRAFLITALTEDTMRVASSLVAPDSLDAVPYERLVPFDAHFMIKRSVLPSAITSTARNSGPGRCGRVGSAGCEERTLIHGRCWQDNIRGSDGAGPVRTGRARCATQRPGIGGLVALKTATGGQGAPLESASSGGRRRTVDVRGAPLSTPVFGVSEKGDARASHYLAAELAGDVEGKKKCYNIKCVNGSPLFVVVTLNRLSIECEVDSGSAVSAMSNTFYTAYFKHQALSRINGSLRCYDGSPITPRGSCSLSVTYRGRTKQIKFYIIDNGCHVQPAPILGRDFMSEFNLGISEMKYIDNPVSATTHRELFAHEGKEFSKLDLSMAYMQLELTEDSQPLTCINTHRGLFNLHDWFWVIVGACDISKTMERILAGIEGICFVIDKDGLHTSPGKVKAIKEAEPPKNVSQLKSFLGLVNYYRSFVPRMSTILGPLHDLLKWVQMDVVGGASERFRNGKTRLGIGTGVSALRPAFIHRAHGRRESDGLGAVLRSSRRTAPRVIAFASRALTPSERVYSQIQKKRPRLFWC
ncbi:Retrovirus-related Pol polyprotein from transposon opus [Eumeta japonica]|uniref:Retrovirus-related Pol polyprotein from transposon opus n=1 Tax=Eumeta variegata TaxID=151549 RepID=A0A4C1UUY7_EUMVA|nr:Retrovirus-related Pol polyprotein from transposon opus [Eumeta japonica]